MKQQWKVDFKADGTEVNKYVVVEQEEIRDVLNKVHGYGGIYCWNITGINQVEGYTKEQINQIVTVE